MTTNVNFKLTSSKLERQGAHVAAEIRHNYTTTQSFLCLQVRDSELQRRGSSPFNLTTPMETQSSTLGRGGLSPQQAPQKSPIVRTQFEGGEKKKERKPRAKTLSAAFVSCQLWRWRRLSGLCSKAFTGGNGMASHIQPQLAAYDHQQMEADANHTSNSVVYMSYCLVFINFSA